MSYSFNRDYNSLSSTNISFDIYNSRLEKIISNSTPASANFTYTGDLGGIYAVPNFTVAENFISDSEFFVDFGDGTIIENNLSAFHKYSAPGNYPVTLVVTSSAGHIARSTSALKYKQDIRDLEDIDIDKFRPIRYKSKSDIDDQTKDHFGFIADEVHDAGITELVSYGDDNEVEGFQYERMTAVLVKTLQEQKKTIASLEARIKILEEA